jgi:hypothetical protein
LLGDDHVGVDIDHLHRRCDALKRGEFVHGRNAPAGSILDALC